MCRDVVITGVGPVTAFGVGIDPLWDGMQGGRSAIRWIQTFDASEFPCRAGAELPADQFEVTIDPRSWVFLAAAGEGSSVHDLADRLGIFEFPTAVQVAEMVRRGLLVPEEESPELSVQTSFQPAAPVPVSSATGGGPVAEIDTDRGIEQ